MGICVWASVSVCLWSSVVICVRYMWDAYIYSCTCLNVHVYVWSLDFVSYLIINLFYPTFWDRLETGSQPEPEVHWLSRLVGDPSVSRLPSGITSSGCQSYLCICYCLYVWSRKQNSGPRVCKQVLAHWVTSQATYPFFQCGLKTVLWKCRKKSMQDLSRIIKIGIYQVSSHS